MQIDFSKISSKKKNEDGLFVVNSSSAGHFLTIVSVMLSSKYQNVEMDQYLLRYSQGWNGELISVLGILITGEEAQNTAYVDEILREASKVFDTPLCMRANSSGSADDYILIFWLPDMENQKVLKVY